MLTVATDAANHNWLVYILEEFKRINKALFDIRVVPVLEQPPRLTKNTIYYTRENNRPVSICNCSGINPLPETERINDHIYIFPNTRSTSKNFLLEYDLFWNAFVILSRYEEYILEKEGKKILSYSSRHPRKKKETFSIPVVNFYFNEFEILIKQHFPNLKFGETDEPKVEFSHDVDYLRKTFQLRMKQTAFNSYNVIKSLARPAHAARLAGKTFKFLFSTPSYWCFDYWEKTDSVLHDRSVLYVYSLQNKKNLKSWLVDPSYDLNNNDRLKNKLRQLVGDGFQVGLHGSYKSALDESQLRQEKENLETFIGQEVTRIRQHWLNYSEMVTPHIHNKLFKFDSTLGWNDRPGFRSGCLSMYRPYDHINDIPFAYYEIPQIVMDSHIFDYAASRHEDEMLQTCIQLFSFFNHFKSVYVSVSWHQRVCSPDYKWHPAYEKIRDAYLFGSGQE
jgi:hypothetical protein